MIDVMKDLRECFDFSAYMILSAWEYERDGMIEAAEQRYVALGPVGYEEAMIANVQAIECQTPPKDAAEFLTTFDAGLRPAGLVFAAEHAAHQPQR